MGSVTIDVSMTTIPRCDVVVPSSIPVPSNPQDFEPRVRVFRCTTPREGVAFVPTVKASPPPGESARHSDAAAVLMPLVLGVLIAAATVWLVLRLRRPPAAA